MVSNRLPCAFQIFGSGIIGYGLVSPVGTSIRDRLPLLDDSVSNVLPNLKIFDDVALVEAGSSMFQLLHQLGCFTAPVLADDGVNFVT